MNPLTKLLDRFRPESQRRERALPDAQLVAALATVDDNSPALAAITDQLHGQFETNVRLALNFHEPPERKLRALDRAAAILDSIELLETNRAEARELKRREEERKPVAKAA